MYINDIHLGYYIGFIILGIFVGEFVSWMNKRLPEYKKVFSKDIFREYKVQFKPNYILMFVMAAICRTFICVWDKRNYNCKFRFNKIYDISPYAYICMYDRF
jgi:H+/Cl- antiporter ClcA